MVYGTVTGIGRKGFSFVQLPTSFLNSLKLRGISILRGFRNNATPSVAAPLFNPSLRSFSRNEDDLYKRDLWNYGAFENLDLSLDSDVFYIYTTKLLKFKDLNARYSLDKVNELVFALRKEMVALLSTRKVKFWLPFSNYKNSVFVLKYSYILTEIDKNIILTKISKSTGIKKEELYECIVFTPLKITKQISALREDYKKYQNLENTERILCYLAELNMNFILLYGRAWNNLSTEIKDGIQNHVFGGPFKIGEEKRMLRRLQKGRLSYEQLHSAFLRFYEFTRSELLKNKKTAKLVITDGISDIVVTAIRNHDPESINLTLEHPLFKLLEIYVDGVFAFESIFTGSHRKGPYEIIEGSDTRFHGLNVMSINSFHENVNSLLTKHDRSVLFIIDLKSLGKEFFVGLQTQVLKPNSTLYEMLKVSDFFTIEVRDIWYGLLLSSYMRKVKGYTSWIGADEATLLISYEKGFDITREIKKLRKTMSNAIDFVGVGKYGFRIAARSIKSKSIEIHDYLDALEDDVVKLKAKEDEIYDANSYKKIALVSLNGRILSDKKPQ
jgi:hypothetical protein